MNVKVRKKGKRENNKRKNRRHSEVNAKGQRYKIYNLKKRSILEELYKSIQYKSGKEEIFLSGFFGLETGDINEFLNSSEAIISCEKAHLFLNIENVTRLWPSGITMLSSLKQWRENGKEFYTAIPGISSSDSKSHKVNEYLNASGFYDFVGRQSQKAYKDLTPGNSIVKISQELSKQNIEVREKEIKDLLKSNTRYDKDQLELFDSIILTETFLNVTEHGIVYSHQGWWILAQLHKKHGFISLNIADNGIGLRNTLLIGPQKDQIEKKLGTKEKHEGEFLKLAMEENVSGAFDASTKSGILIGTYEKGSRRGNGLKRIKATCKELRISFTILSHFGFIRYNELGELDLYGSRKNRVFAGTLYHFKIPI
ncbi:ATP-binding protein [Leptospira yasudae]|uniref:ATP-binding protein n=1 Tax=Leptospira yasudae TaxID=2202201 RepID=UPI001C4E3612|nr:ATP-binding protein [Leptospira yasudae]MBW0435210.1 ATP-binding protein [Leptospira yasudae]